MTASAHWMVNAGMAPKRIRQGRIEAANKTRTKVVRPGSAARNINEKVTRNSRIGSPLRSVDPNAIKTSGSSRTRSSSIQYSRHSAIAKVLVLSTGSRIHQAISLDSLLRESPWDDDQPFSVITRTGQPTPWSTLFVMLPNRAAFQGRD